MKTAKPDLHSLKPVTLPSGLSRQLTQPELDRLWPRVTQSESGCWIWTGRRFKAGYGAFDLNQKAMYAHRIMYMIFIGEIPQGAHLDHLCRVRECCNPQHLQAVTCHENIMRSPIAPAAVNADKTHCKRGHPLSGDNLEVREDGGRRCRTCAITSARQRYATATNTPLNEAPIALSSPPAPRRRRGSEVCAKGHVLDSQNTYTDPKGYKHCRACRAASQSRHEARKKAR
ncbi:HNH endonuclease signature motif containing protein [Streptomyces azureus]|uniref:HNH endonuclease n=1 Tax=Streptomyces azureus TaxID=146537 RepID=A0A0K8PG97_STRAJ|nr:HNH endonuclease signature motif containing protein [Streptomyces azureus]GAP46906.1 HNH endonuclease [Streptomyces azureus]